MKRILSIAALALLCATLSLVSCKKKDDPVIGNNVIINGKQEKVARAFYEQIYSDGSLYHLCVELESGLGLTFSCDKANDGNRIDLTKPDPLAPKSIVPAGKVGYWYYRVFAYSVTDKFASDDIADGNPSGSLDALSEGSYMQITRTKDGFSLKFELKDVNLSETYKANGVTVSGDCRDFFLLQAE